jgi:hypothetical protein
MLLSVFQRVNATATSPNGPKSATYFCWVAEVSMTAPIFPIDPSIPTHLDTGLLSQ